jgi:hypothetical protein
MDSKGNHPDPWFSPLGVLDEKDSGGVLLIRVSSVRNAQQAAYKKFGISCASQERIRVSIRGSRESLRPSGAIRRRGHPLITPPPPRDRAVPDPS